MGKQNDSWGIEVGANALKAARLVYDGEVVSVVDYDVIPFKMPLVTPDLDADEQIQVALDQFLSNHETKKSTIMVSVPGHAAFARFAKLPPVDPKKIGEIVRFEAAQQVPFPIEQVEWDYQTFQSEDSPDVEVGIFAITKERVAQFMSNYRAVGLKIDGLTMSPLAVFNGLCYDLNLDPKQDSMAFVDIGTTSTDVIICDHGAVWIRTLQIGGNDFTEALMRAFKVSYPKAEKLKREARTSKYARQIFQAMRPVFADLVQELQRSLGFYQSMNRDAEITRLIGVGSTFRLPGLQKFLKQQLNMEVIRPSRFERLEIDGKHEADFADHAVNMATVYGLGIQGLGLEWLTANLLPKQIVRERVWKSKQPWFAAAAGLMAASVGATYAYQSYLQGAYDPTVQETDRIVTPVLDEASDFASEWRKASSFKPRENEIKNLSNLFMHKEIWPNLLKDINAALAAVDPQPALLSNNYEEIEAIPRRDRRRLYITDFSVSYELIDPSMELRDQLAKEEEEREDKDISKEEKKRIKEREKRLKEQAEDQELIPRMIVSLEGTTPLDNDEAIQLITGKFLGYLRSIAKRPDFAYEYIFDDLPLEIIKAAGPEAYRSKAMKEQGSGGSRRRGGANPMMMQGMGMPGMGMGGMTPAMMGGGGRATGDNPAEFLPDQPMLADPASMEDQKFTLKWKINMLPENERYSAEELEQEKAEQAKEADAGREEASAPASSSPTSPTAHNTEASSTTVVSQLGSTSQSPSDHKETL